MISTEGDQGYEMTLMFLVFGHNRDKKFFFIMAKEKVSTGSSHVIKSLNHVLNDEWERGYRKVLK